MDVLLIDNYDSFTHNLAQLLGMCGARVTVRRNDDVTLQEIMDQAPERIILSPGPGHPQNPRDFGICKNIVLELGAHIPTLGICLGHQGIVHCLGGRVVRAPSIVHGKTSQILHGQDGIFARMAPAFEAMRYHSFTAERSSLPPCLRVTAATEDGLIMAIEHREWPMVGLQFHPESIGTPSGAILIENFLGEGARR